MAAKKLLQILIMGFLVLGLFFTPSTRYMLQEGMHTQTVLGANAIPLTNDESRIAFLVKDLNPEIDSYPGTNPEELISAGHNLFFVSTFPSPPALWVSDGTQIGTMKVLDTYTGISRLTAVGDNVFFEYFHPEYGYELWINDGTPSGSRLVKDIQPGNFGAYIDSLTESNGYLYFNANDGVHGIELWRSDGTESGTFMVKDIRTGINSSNPRSFVSFGGYVYFLASYGLWKTDGTDSGTVLVNDLGGHSNGVIITAGSRLFLTTGGSYLWVSDGTTEGTIQIGNYESIDYLTAINDNVYFSAPEIAENSSKELWFSDGTTEGTRIVKNINPFSEHGQPRGSNPRALVEKNDLLYFFADDGIHGIELWKSDGTTNGTMLVSEINPTGDGPDPDQLIPLNNHLYFRAFDGVFHGLWKSDGTQTGTIKVKTGITPENLIAHNSKIYFSAGVQDHQELWKSDGTTLGTSIAYDHWVGKSSVIHGMETVDSDLYFGNQPNINNVYEYYLWHSDGSRRGTQITTRSLYWGPLPSDLDYDQQRIAYIHGQLYTAGVEGIYGSEIRQIGDFPGGARIIEDINPGQSGSSVQEMIVMDDVMYFYANRLNVEGLWRSDGKPGGTQFVKGIAPEEFVALNGILYFIGYNNIRGRELWRSDGTPEGTYMVKDINPYGNAIAEKLFVFGSYLYFGADDGVHGHELWKSDGTRAGTTIVKDINPGSVSGWVFGTDMVAVNENIYFVGRDGTHWEELWKTDGTRAGTTMVKDIFPGNESIYGPRALTRMNNLLYFFATENYESGTGLWQSDGTSAGTRKIINVMPSYADIRDSEIDMVAGGGRLYFPAWSGMYGINNEMWESDGTAVGTYQIQEIASSLTSSHPKQLTKAGPYIFFTADDIVHGRELWALPFSSDLEISINPTSLGAKSGKPITYDVLVSNRGLTAQTVELSISFPNSFDLVMIEPSDNCVQVTNNINCTLGDLEAFEQHSFVLQLQPTTAGKFQITAQLNSSSNESDLQNNLVTLQQVVSPAIDYFPSLNSRFCAGGIVDQFDDPTSGWLILRGDTIYYEYLNREYRIYNRPANQFVGAFAPFQADQFTLDLSLRNFGDLEGSYGIIFGATSDQSEFFTFEISRDANYGLYRYTSTSGWEPLVQGNSPAILGGNQVNLLQLKHASEGVQVFANGQLLVSLNNKLYQGSRSLGVLNITPINRGNLDVRYDQFIACPAGTPITFVENSTWHNPASQNLEFSR